jgi:hypothetical protein
VFSVAKLARETRRPSSFVMPGGQQRGACCALGLAWWSLSLVAEVLNKNTLGFLPREPHRCFRREGVRSYTTVEL